MAEPEPRVSQEPLRVGIVNIMPKAESYERLLLKSLADDVHSVEPIWIRLESHRYGSSDHERIAHYSTFAQAVAKRQLAGVILTGAPVEELAFDQVSYWSELTSILQACRTSRIGTLGICWGGLALAKLLDIEKRVFERKLFGVFENTTIDLGHGIGVGVGEVFRCAHSRHSGIDDRELESARAAGVVHLLAHGPETGYTIFESADGAALMHLGHPEYEPARLVHEWERDLALGRPDVDPPRHFDPARPTDDWQLHGRTFFKQWLRRLPVGRAPQSPKESANAANKPQGGHHVAPSSLRRS